MFVYIMTNSKNKTLYVGVTNDLYRRVMEHKQGLVSSFTDQYQLYKLVYYEQVAGADEAIRREKQLKRWHRDWKVNLISEMNPNWEDLSESVLGISSSNETPSGMLKRVQHDRSIRQHDGTQSQS